MLQVDTNVIISHIPPDFIGLGYETSAVAQSNYFSPKNTTLVQLYRNLSRHGLIRIGGIISDHTRYEPDGTPVAHTQTGVTVINKSNLTDLGDFARATGWSVMWGLNLGTGSRSDAVAEAQDVAAALGKNLHSFEVGNEVEELRHTYAAYHSNYLDYKTAIRALIPDAPFSGPDSIGREPYVTSFAADESADIKLLTTHYYRGDGKNTNSTLAKLLHADTNFNKRLDDTREVSEKSHVPYRINEVNSYSSGGRPGFSDTFGAALWCLDYMFNLAAHGCSGVNMETDINQLGFISHYSPIVHDASGDCHARPEYYAMLAFALSGNGDLVKAALDKNDLNLSAYATRDTNGLLWLTIINKNFSQDANVATPLPKEYSTASAFRFTAPSVTSTNNVSLAGNEISADGKWSAGSPEKISVTDGAIHFEVPHASAVLIQCAPSKSQ